MVPRPVLNLPHTSGNPYQALIYRGSGFRPQPLGRGDWQALADPAAPRLLHLHWDDRLFARSPDSATNARDTEAKIARLARFRAAGGRILWTVHNRLPHKIADEAGFRAARARIAMLADRVHVHSREAIEHVREAYDVPADRIRHIPHPSYLGAYEPAEVTLGRDMPPAGERHFLFFGALRGNKGVQEIIAVARKLTRRDYPYRLTMAGKAFASQRRLRRFAGFNPRITFIGDRIPDDGIPALFSAAHFLLLPARGILTSGTAHLALTFGLPVIGPRIPALSEVLPPPCHPLLYDPASPRGLIRSMIRAIDMAEGELAAMRQAALSRAQELAPEIVGRQLGKLLEELAAETASPPVQTVGA